MESYENEHDQLEALKRFFAENGKALIAGVVLGIIALVGWRYWSSSQSEANMNSSLQYQEVTGALNADKPATLSAADQFVTETQNSYGALAALAVAQKYIDKNLLPEATTQLQHGLANTGDENLQALINIRLARLQVQQKQTDAALKTLDTIKGDGWVAIVADLRGEALLSKGDTKGARDAWSKGADSNASPALREMMKMKINNLSS